MDSCSETEAKCKTGHSYESIERYLFDFSQVICLLLVPVALTLLTPKEQAQDLNNRGDLKPLMIRQIVRVTAGAWQLDS